MWFVNHIPVGSVLAYSLAVLLHVGTCGSREKAIYFYYKLPLQGKWGEDQD